MSNTSMVLVYESRFTTHNTLWISCSPWRGFCGRREIFWDLHYTHWKIYWSFLSFSRKIRMEILKLNFL